MIGIYKITNQLNGKVYIGQSIDIKERWRQHKKAWKDISRNSNLYQAIREDGLENFKFEVIEECPKELLNEKEHYWINEYNSLETGYNMNVLENLQYKINWKIAREIMDLLSQNQLTMKEIAKIYDVSYSLISLINSGEMWYDDRVSYPIRPAIKTKEKNTCLICGKVIDRRSKYCLSCYKLKNSINSKINKNELKKMIREKSLAEVSRYYKVHVRTLKRWCEKFNLPSTKTEINSYSEEDWEKI